MKCNSGRSFSAVLVSQILQTFFQWLFYDSGLFLQVAIKELTKCQYQKFVNYLVLADKFKRLQIDFLPYFFYFLFFVNLSLAD